MIFSAHISEVVAALMVAFPSLERRHQVGAANCFLLNKLYLRSCTRAEDERKQSVLNTQAVGWSPCPTTSMLQINQKTTTNNLALDFLLNFTPHFIFPISLRRRRGGEETRAGSTHPAAAKVGPLRTSGHRADSARTRDENLIHLILVA